MEIEYIHQAIVQVSRHVISNDFHHQLECKKSYV